MITLKKGFMSSQNSQADSQSLIDLWTLLSSNGISLSKGQMDSLERYHNELRYWNERVNMISRKDMDNIWDRHIIHSLCLLKYATFKPKARVLDFGTGGGLPGIPLKIARPDIHMTLVDSIGKKMKMTEMFAQHTGLKDLDAVTSRVEELSADSHYRGAFDVVVSRAVAPIAKIVRWSRALLNETGQFAFLKGGDLDDEVTIAQEVFPDLKVSVKPIEIFGLPQFKEDDKKVVVCEL